LLSKSQEHTTRNRSDGPAIRQHRTTYDLAYSYDDLPHAPSRIGDDSYRYDLNGNTILVDHLESGRRRTMVWDEDDRLASVSDNGHTTSFVYDHSGQRAAKIGVAGETVYVNSLFTVRNGRIATKHVFVGDERVASRLSPGDAHVRPTEDDLVSTMLGRWWLHRSARGWERASNTEMNPHYRVPSETPEGGTPDNNFLYFYHSDHLGSTSYVTDTDGELYEHVQYFPSGEVWVQEASNTERLPYLFTSRELDQETGLYALGLRYYDSRTSLWASPDPVLDDYLDGAPNDGIFRPGNLSPYCYSWNSPVNLADPDGTCPWCVVIGGVIIGAAINADVAGDSTHGASRQRSDLDVYGTEVLQNAIPGSSPELAGARTGTTVMLASTGVRGRVTAALVAAEARARREATMIRTAVERAVRGRSRESDRRETRAQFLRVREPAFAQLRDHARRHSQLSPAAYYRQAVEHMRTGRRFQFRHEGQTRNAFVTRRGQDTFTFTSASPSGRRVFTHMEVNAQYLRNNGITLPQGF
jgi:RHS repeat-associated protein